ncbi:hypothetical protein BKA62DRAFT_706361 [Auriculariales sp. MPI-PUGE-AT-0066]|nr:hypothetical protein BKA62DRAFT_706361 [Auriculariales sp. MPI-PUGE-AT-0066]
MMMGMNSQASASTSVLPLPWSQDAAGQYPHRLRLPFSASTPVITLSPANIAVEGDTIMEEPDEMSPRTPVSADTPRSPRSPRLGVPRPQQQQQQQQPRGVPPSQSEDEAMQLALVLAFGNDKYSSALATPTSPISRPYSTPPSYFASRPKTPVSARFAGSPGPTPPHSPTGTPRDSREQRQRTSESDSDSLSPPPQLQRSRALSTPPPPPLDLRFESDYSADSTTSTTTSPTGSLAGQMRNPARRSTYNLNSQPLRKPEGTVMVPLPLMLRPRPIWRTTPRSALSSPAYAPAAHLVRRSTFIAAGLDMKSPVADLSALAVETRALMFGRDAGVVLPGFEV